MRTTQYAQPSPNKNTSKIKTELLALIKRKYTSYNHTTQSIVLFLPTSTTSLYKLISFFPPFLSFCFIPRFYFSCSVLFPHHFFSLTSFCFCLLLNKLEVVGGRCALQGTLSSLNKGSLCHLPFHISGLLSVRSPSNRERSRTSYPTTSVLFRSRLLLSTLQTIFLRFLSFYFTNASFSLLCVLNINIFFIFYFSFTLLTSFTIALSISFFRSCILFFLFSLSHVFVHSFIFVLFF